MSLSVKSLRPLRNNSWVSNVQQTLPVARCKGDHDIDDPNRHILSNVVNMLGVQKFQSTRKAARRRWSWDLNYLDHMIYLIFVNIFGPQACNPYS